MSVDEILNKHTIQDYKCVVQNSLIYCHKVIIFIIGDKWWGGVGWGGVGWGGVGWGGVGWGGVGWGGVGWGGGGVPHLIQILVFYIY